MVKRRFDGRMVGLLSSILVLVNTATVAAGAMLLHIGSTMPRVGQRGTTVEVTIQGMCLKDAQEIIFYKPGIRATKFESLPDLKQPIGLMHGGRIAEQFRCQFEIAANCEPGEYPFRVRTRTELTSLGTFHVSPFVCIDENETGEKTNDTLATALEVPLNVTVRGRMGPSARGDVDLYRVPVTTGQRLSVEVASVRIADTHYGGSEYDLALRILDDSGKELATNDDNPLHLQDPMVSVKIPRDGFAYVEVQRSLFVPHDKVYTVHIGSNPRPLVVYPPGGPAGTTQSFTLLGDPLGEAVESIVVPTHGGSFAFFGDAPSPVTLRASPYPNVLEDEAAAETRVERLPAALNGRIDRRDDIDAFRVPVKQGERYRVRVYAAALGSPIDPKLRIRPANVAGEVGPVDIEQDDCGLPDRDIFGTSFRSRGGLKEILDPSVIWEPKADGDYRIELEDTSASGGPTAVYRIEVEPVTNAVYTLLASTAFDWEECMRTSALAIPQGNRWTVNLSLPQGQGNTFRSELDLIAHGLPDGVRLIAGRVPAGRTIWPIQFEADATARPSASLISIEAQSADAAEKLESRSQQAIPFINHSGGDAWRTVRLDGFVLAVTEPAPFQVEISPPPAALVRGGELAIPLKIHRQPGFNEPVEFQCDWVSPGVSVQPATIIPAGETDAVLRITGELNAPLGKCPLVVSACTTRDDLDAYLGTARIQQAVQRVHVDSHGIYGSVKVAQVLNERDGLERACRNTVAQAMRKLGLKSRVCKRFTPTTTRVDPTQQPAPNTLDQDFTAVAPNRKWVTDITYLATATGWVYLAVVLDLFSPKVVGWALGPTLETELVSTALRRAIEARRPDGRQLLHHSDRGCQYTSAAYRQTLNTLGIECSMSRTGCCYDNAVMERFFWSLKHEWTNHEPFAILEDARLSVFRYIETFYNSQRLHQTLGYQSPNTFEALFQADHAPASAA